MDIASLILSTIALLLSITCLTLMLAKNFFSTHVVQMTPVDPFSSFKPQSSGTTHIADELRDFETPLSEEEAEYFKKQNKPT